MMMKKKITQRTKLLKKTPLSQMRRLMKRWRSGARRDTLPMDLELDHSDVEALTGLIGGLEGRLTLTVTTFMIQIMSLNLRVKKKSQHLLFNAKTVSTSGAGRGEANIRHVPMFLAMSKMMTMRMIMEMMAINQTMTPMMTPTMNQTQTPIQTLTMTLTMTPHHWKMKSLLILLLITDP